jgi:hypothetical protein
MKVWINTALLSLTNCIFFYQITNLITAEHFPNMDPMEIAVKLNLLSTMMKRYCGTFKECEVPHQDRPIVKVSN